MSTKIPTPGSWYESGKDYQMNLDTDLETEFLLNDLMTQADPIPASQKEPDYENQMAHPDYQKWILGIEQDYQQSKETRCWKSLKAAVKEIDCFTTSLTLRQIRELVGLYKRLEN